MKRICVTVLCAAALSFAFVSCASKPEAAEESLDKVEEAVEQAEETADIVNEQIDSATLEAVEDARAKALEAGADKYAADLLNMCDAAYEMLKSQSDAGQNVGIALADLQKRYQALAQYSNAVKAKERIDELNFASYDQKSYDEGCEALDSFKNFSSINDVLAATMLEKADTAYANLKNVLQAGFKVLAKQERTNAFAAKQKADGIKAAVASKENYSNAVTEFRAGDSSYAMQNPEAAYNHWVSSTKMFNELYTEVSEKREAALKAMEEARSRVLESQNYAATADAEVPLEGENIQGIEEADAVLLEEDNYETPESQIEEIPEEISDEVVEQEAE